MHKIIRVIILLIGVTFITQACASSSPKPGEMPDLGTIKIGYVPAGGGTAAIYIAADKGLFAEKGLNVELERFNSGSKMIAPLSTGQLDVGAGEVGTTLFNAINQELNMKVVCSFAGLSEGYGGAQFLVLKDLSDSGEIAAPADLAGRKVGINVPRGMAEYRVAKVLEKDGLSIEDVELVSLPFPDMPSAFANNAIDAATIPETLGGRAIKEGSAAVFFEGDEIAGDIQTAVMYFGKRFLDPANKEVAVRFLEVYLTQLRELIQDPGYIDEENLEIIMKYTNTPAEVIKSSKNSYFDPNCEFFEESVEDAQNYYVSRGYTEYSQPLPLSEVIDRTFMDEALNRIGEYQK